MLHVAAGSLAVARVTDDSHARLRAEIILRTVAANDLADEVAPSQLHEVYNHYAACCFCYERILLRLIAALLLRQAAHSPPKDSPLPQNPLVLQRHGDILISGQDAGREITGAARGAHQGLVVIRAVGSGGRVRLQRDALGSG